MSLKNQKGTSLLEILVAVALITGILVPLTLAFPSLKQGLFKNRQQLVAVQLANTEIANIKSRSYPYLDTTDASYFSGGPCDCTANNFSVFQVLPSTLTIENGIPYKLKSCVHYVGRSGSAWAPQCAADGDTGYKSVIVRVEWMQAGKEAVVSQETMSSRYK